MESGDLCCYSYLPFEHAMEACNFVKKFQGFKRVCDKEDVATIP